MNHHLEAIRAVHGYARECIAYKLGIGLYTVKNFLSASTKSAKKKSMFRGLISPQ